MTPLNNGDMSGQGILLFRERLSSLWRMKISECFLYSECHLSEVHCSSFLLEGATSTHIYVILNIHFQKTIKITQIIM